MIKSPGIWIKIIIVGFGLYLLSQVTAIYFPVIVAMALAFVLNPPVNFVASIPIGSRKYRLPRSIAILIVFILSALIFAVVTTYVLVPIIGELNKFAVDLPRLVTRLSNLTVIIGERTNTAQLPDNVRMLITDAISSAASYGVALIKSGINAVFAFATGIVELVVAPVLAYYFLKDSQCLKIGVVKLFNVSMHSVVVSVIDEMAQVISNYIRGQVLLSAIMGLIVFCGMYLFGVDYPLVLGLLAALTEAIPIVGPIIGAAPAIILAYLASPVLATKVVLFYLIIQQLENHIVLPNIMGHTIDLHPILVILSLLIGGQLYGIAGMILAVPVAALLRVLLRRLWYYEEVKKDG